MDDESLLSHFPSVNVALTYGSGVFSQPGYNAYPPPMLDMIFGVEDAGAWHRENFQRNRSHYVGLGHLGPRVVTSLQENFGAGMWYNTLVPYPGEPGRFLKYGVISMGALVDDLREWRTLYVSGRLHKPVRMLVGGEKGGVFDAAQQLNLRHALHASLLLQRRVFCLGDLLHGIVGLSYGGDFRMVLGEHPRKVEHIVEGSKDALLSLYLPSIQNHPLLRFPSAPLTPSSPLVTPIERDASSEACIALASSLPSWILRAMAWRHAELLPSRGVSVSRLSEEDLQQVARGTRDQWDVTLERAPIAWRQVAKRAIRDGKVGLQELRARSRSKRRARAERMRRYARDERSGDLSPSPSYTSSSLSSSSSSSSSSSFSSTPSSSFPPSRSHSNSSESSTLPWHGVGRASHPFEEAASVEGLWIGIHRAGANAPELTADLLRPTLANLVSYYSASQSLKGIISAGPARSTRYVAAKLAKWVKGLRG